jgi:hypothetical protein
VIDIGWGVLLITRGEWGARPPRSTSGINPTFGTTAHWEGPHLGWPWAHGACFSLVRGIQNFHMNDRGWADIAYTGVACGHGFVFEGRWLGRRTAANGTNDGNSRAYALCYLGGQGDPFTHDGRRAMRAGLDYLDANGAGPGRNGHRDWKATECPGNEIYQWVRAGQPVDPSSPPPPPPPPPPPDTQGDPRMDGIWHGNMVHFFLVRRDGALVERWGPLGNPQGFAEIFPPGSCRTGSEARVKVIDPAPSSEAYGYAVAALSADGDWVRYAWWAGDHWEKP